MDGSAQGEEHTLCSRTHAVHTHYSESDADIVLIAWKRTVMDGQTSEVTLWNIDVTNRSDPSISPAIENALLKGLRWKTKSAREDVALISVDFQALYSFAIRPRENKM